MEEIFDVFTSWTIPGLGHNGPAFPLNYYITKVRGGGCLTIRVCHENQTKKLKLLPPITLLCIYINKRKNTFSIFLRLIYVPYWRGYTKKMKNGLKINFPFILFWKISTLPFLKLLISFQTTPLDIWFFDFWPLKRIF